MYRKLLNYKIKKLVLKSPNQIIMKTCL